LDTNAIQAANHPNPDMNHAIAAGLFCFGPSKNLSAQCTKEKTIVHIAPVIGM